MELSSPGMCLAEKVKLYTRVKIVIERTRSIILGDLERFELIMVTTGKLSHHIQIRFPDQEGPQR